MKISTATISKLTPIIDQIDAELAKEQEDRVDFQVYTDNTNSLKNALVHYKSLFRRTEWNGKFWIVKSSNKKTGEDFLDFRFSAKPTTKFSFEIKKEEDKDDLAFTIRSNEPVPADGPVRELSDNQITSLILMESPNSAVFDRKYLSAETNAWLDDPKNADTSALINVCERRGYKVTTVLGSRMRIYL